MGGREPARIDHGTDKGVRSLSTAIKVLRMLDFVVASPVPRRLGEAASALGLSRATAYQQLKTLVESGWIEIREDGRYQMSLKSVIAAGTALRHMNLGDRIRPILERLVHETGETASITAIQDDQPVIIQRVEIDRPIVARQEIGTRLDLTTSASGRVHIVFDDSKALLAVERSGACQLPPEEVRRIRDSRVAFSEPGTGLLAAATPILDRQERCVAALSLVGLEHRNEISDSGPLLIAAAEEISGHFVS